MIDKRHFYEESTKVPFLARCPELFKGAVVSKMFQNVDVAPTIQQAGNLQMPVNTPGSSSDY
ncbi:sulfatase/phosphatase domain-containing protein [Mucilaginibacter kameinonensis]|uniref:sulfatase/phosphatase domain-containing protein n=1 Tax=Mucilaginibacter kameinonensis TaxID=452286 RepID=UPI0037423D41